MEPSKPSICSKFNFQWINPYSEGSKTKITTSDVKDFIFLLSRIIKDNKNIYNVLNLFLTFVSINKIQPKDYTKYLLAAAYTLFDKDKIELKDTKLNIFNFDNQEFINAYKDLIKLNLDNIPSLNNLNSILVECLETKPLSQKNIDKLAIILLQPQNQFLFNYNIIDRIEIISCLLTNRCISKSKTSDEKKKEEIELKEFLLDPSMDSEELLDKEVKFNIDYPQPNIIYSLPLPIVENIVLDKCPLEKINWINPFSFQSQTYFSENDLKKFISMLLFVSDATYFDILSTLDVFFYYASRRLLSEDQKILYLLATFVLLYKNKSSKKELDKIIKGLYSSQTIIQDELEFLVEMNNKGLEIQRMIGNIQTFPYFRNLMNLSKECMGIDIDKMSKEENTILNKFVKNSFRSAEVLKYHPVDRYYGILCQSINACNQKIVPKLEQILKAIKLFTVTKG